MLILASEAEGFGGWHGSGFLISEDGYIVTVAHNVEGAAKLEVALYGETTRFLPAEVIASDPEQDVALIKIDQTNLPFLEFWDSDALKENERLMALGHPWGLKWVATIGAFLANRDGLLMSKIPGMSGLSGGAIVNMDGEVVGLFAGSMPDISVDPYTPSSFDVLEDICYSQQPEESYAVPGNTVQAIIQPYLEP